MNVIFEFGGLNLILMFMFMIRDFRCGLRFGFGLICGVCFSLFVGCCALNLIVLILRAKIFSQCIATYPWNSHNKIAISSTNPQCHHLSIPDFWNKPWISYHTPSARVPPKPGTNIICYPVPYPLSTHINILHQLSW